MPKQGLRERLQKRKKELSEKSSTGSTIYLKEGTLRCRVLPTGSDEEFVQEVTQFYLGEKLKGVYSPSTFNEPCALMEAYTKFKNSKKPEEQEIAKRLSPKSKYLMPVVVFEDQKGLKINTKDSGKLVQITNGLYQAIIDLYLDEDEWGDMTDPKKGYDIKLTRVGKSMTDTEYSVAPCKNTPLDKTWAKKEINLEEMVKKIMPTYEETKDYLEQFLGSSVDDDEEDDRPRKKKNKLQKKNRRKF